MDYTMDNIMIVFILVIGFGVVVAFAIYDVNRKKRINVGKTFQGDTEKVIMYAKKYVCDILKCPITAQFDSIDIMQCDDYGRVYVEAVVDSQNSYGAMVRTKIGLVLRPKEDEYIAIPGSTHIINSYNDINDIKLNSGWGKPFPNSNI